MKPNDGAPSGTEHGPSRGRRLPAAPAREGDALVAHRTTEVPADGRAERGPGWERLVDGRGTRVPRPPSVRRVLARFVIANLLAVAVLVAGSIWASFEAASKVSLADAGAVTDLVARALVEPNL